MSRILLIEDDPMIGRSLKMSLSYEGFEVEVANTCAVARSLFERREFDFYIIDVNLPDGSGFDLCQTVRAKSETVPIVMLTAKVDEESAMKGMSLGADDYLRKPFGPKELTLRIQKMLERKVKIPRVVKFGKLNMDLNKHLAFAGEIPLELGPKEFAILRLLMQRQGDAVSRDEIMVALGDGGEIYDRTVDSHLSHLRKKFREAGLKNIAIASVYGVGYRLERR